MNSRLCRSIGALFAAGALGGCATPPSLTTATSPAITTQTATAAATPDAASSSKLGSAAAIQANIPDVSGFRQAGRASWYGRHFNGRRSASGERFDMHALTAAHKTLPLASYVRVTNTTNQKSVVVRINDRGPYVRGRVIDLSYAAARELDLEHTGTARVRIVGLTQQEAAQAQHDAIDAASNSFKEAQR